MDAADTIGREEEVEDMALRCEELTEPSNISYGGIGSRLALIVYERGIVEVGICDAFEQGYLDVGWTFWKGFHVSY
jgi:hypothetical protein